MSRRHAPTTGWSLTSYLKVLHSGGMTWEAIYWHVWSACVVMRPTGDNLQTGGGGGGQDMCVDYTVSALDVDRYSLDSDGVVIYSR